MERVPHFINANGVPEPYSKESLAERRESALRAHAAAVQKMKGKRAQYQDEIIKRRLAGAVTQTEI
jgi:hypothetical protein